MRIPLPFGLIAIFISFCLFYYFNQKNKIKKQLRRERLEEKQQELLATLRKKANTEQEAQGSDTTKVQ